jgi:hypothetical protein
MRIFDILPAVNGRGFFQSRPLELLVQRVHLLTTSCETITRDGSLLSLLVYFNTLFLYALQYSSNLNNWFSIAWCSKLLPTETLLRGTP